MKFKWLLVTVFIQSIISLLYFVLYGLRVDRNIRVFENHEEKAQKFIETAENVMLKYFQIDSTLQWKYETEMSQDNERIARIFTSLLNQQLNHLIIEAQKLTSHDPIIQRKIKMLNNLDELSGGPQAKVTELRRIINEMTRIYSTAKIPSFEDGKKSLSLEPDMEIIFRESRNPDELAYYWSRWRDLTGRKMRKLYMKYIRLKNEIAVYNGYQHGGEVETKAIHQLNMDEIWHSLEPLYQHLHAYVRHTLVNRYGEKNVPRNGPIPAHLLGNMWAQHWGNVHQSAAISRVMRDRRWNVRDMIKSVEAFMQSMGLPAMTKQFWEKSIFEKPENDNILCHASAGEMFFENDYRLKQCSSVSLAYLATLGHEMGHIQYMMAYKNQSFLFQKFSDLGFDESVAELFSISIQSIFNLKRLNLIEDETAHLDAMLNLAMEKVAFMPYSAVVHRYRQRLFAGEIKPRDANCEWVKMRLEMQGISPPTKRTGEDFDPGAKFHVAGDEFYSQYFHSIVYQFLLLRALCVKSGHDPSQSPLHLCDLYGKKEAGKYLRSLLSSGSSRTFQNILATLNRINGYNNEPEKALIEYFTPLLKWLKAQNARNNATIGWKHEPLNYYCH